MMEKAKKKKKKIFFLKGWRVERENKQKTKRPHSPPSKWTQMLGHAIPTCWANTD